MVSWWLIGYDRDDAGKWGILAQQWEAPKGRDEEGGAMQWHDEAEPAAEVCRLASASRELRVAAAPHLEELVELVTKKARETLDRLREARARIAE